MKILIFLICTYLACTDNKKIDKKLITSKPNILDKYNENKLNE